MTPVAGALERREDFVLGEVIVKLGDGQLKGSREAAVDVEGMAPGVDMWDWAVIAVVGRDGERGYEALPGQLVAIDHS